MQRELHMIGNAHLDPVWLWRWPEGLQAIRATFRSALDRMKETPGFVFTAAQAAMYEWVERCEPGLFAEIRDRVSEGRWVLVGGWWMQPDCNLPSGEAMARQSLYGQRYFAERFGTMARVAYNVDSFGHSAMLPQILNLSGMKYYVFMRPGPHEKPDIPGRLFRWRSPDGSEVLTYQIPYSYTSSWGAELKEKIGRSAEELSDEVPLLMCFYGVGNHGGGPTRENLTAIGEMASAWDADPERPAVLLSDPYTFFRAVEARHLALPVVQDELQHHASGCYAAHSEIKALNRRAEHALASAEKLAVAAGVLAGAKYPCADLRKAWHGVLFNQFHDILAGTSIRESYVDARNLHGQALQIAEEVSAFSLQSVTAHMNLAGPGIPIVVWNPLGHRRVGPAQVEVHGEPSAPALEDAEGREVPWQEVGPSAVIRGKGRRGVTFMADVPPLGYRTYWLRRRAAQPVESRLVAEPGLLANEHLEIRFDTTTGAICEARLLAGGWRVFSGPAAVPVVMEDLSDTWSHGVFRFDKEVGRFGSAQLELLEAGPVRATVRAESHWGSSRVIQEFSLYAGLPYIDVRVQVDWREQLKALKLEFPVNVTEGQPTYEVQFGAFARPADGEEEPALHWFDVSGDAGTGGRGVAIANDSKYSYDVDGNCMHLTVLRSPVYAHHVPRELDTGEHYHFIDQGWQEFTYRVIPHQGSWQVARVPHLGYELNVPFTAVVESNREGSLPTTNSLLDISARNVILSAVKRAEDGDATIVRVYEAYGQPADCDFAWRGVEEVSWKSSLRPYEIQTFRIADGPGAKVRPVNLIEQEIDKAV